MVTNSAKLHFPLVLRKITNWKAMKKNRFMGRWTTFFLAAGLMSTAVLSCKESEEDKVSPKAMTDIILENPDFSMLKEIMIHADMSDAFRSQNYTFFAPDNAAFNKANIFSSSVITSMHPDSAARFLQKHCLKGPTVYSELKAGEKESIIKTKITIDVKDNVVTVNKSDIVKKDVNASNGVIQVIDSVLVNPIK